MSEDDYKVASISREAIELANSPREEVVKEILDRMRAAEITMMATMSRELFGEELPAVTAEQGKEWERRARMRKLLTPYFWLKSRVLGVFNVLLHGECKQCDIESEY